MTVTTIERNDGVCITRTGSSGFTVTCVRHGMRADVLIEFDEIQREEMQAMVAMLLAQLEEMCGERFVTQCFAHYAEDTGKKPYEEHGGRFYLLRGRK